MTTWEAALGLAVLGGMMGVATAAESAGDTRVIRLDAAALFGGFTAQGVLLDAQKDAVVVAPETAKSKNAAGVLVTDPIDVGPREGLFGIAATLRAVDAAVETDGAADAAAVRLTVRTGPSLFSEQGWSAWTDAGAAGGTVAQPAGRYAQVRIEIPADTGVAVRALVLNSRFQALQGSARLRLQTADIQKIVRSPVDFRYESPDQPKVRRFRERAKLDSLAVPGAGDLATLVNVMDWVGSCSNDRTSHPYKSDGYYAWDIDKVFDIVKGEGGKETPTIYGHCMSYAEVLVTAATALGFKGRHLVTEGFREANHEVVEIWVPSLAKWVFFDPSLTHLYLDKDTGKPLSLLEIQRVVADTFVPDGKTMSWWIVRSSDETRRSVREAGGRTPIAAREGPWHYGQPALPGYDWGWYHGYMAYGFVQMTPRNDFHSHPEANPKRFEHGPGYAGYPFWVDDKTPLRGGGMAMRRERDFYWTLDQASLRLETVQGDETRLRVEFGHSMPFFKAYRVTVGGKEVAVEPGKPFDWVLTRGLNTLKVEPLDERGQAGTGSAVSVVYLPSGTRPARAG